MTILVVHLQKQTWLIVTRQTGQEKIKESLGIVMTAHQIRPLIGSIPGGMYILVVETEVGVHNSLKCKCLVVEVC